MRWWLMVEGIKERLLGGPPTHGDTVLGLGIALSWYISDLLSPLLLVPLEGKLIVCPSSCGAFWDKMSVKDKDGLPHQT